MTTVAFDGQTLAADKQSSNGNAGHGSVCKIFAHEGSLLAISGGLGCGNALVAWFKAGADVSKPPAIKEEELASLIVITPERVIQVYEHPYLAPVVFDNKRQAFGSGRDFAIAAMELGCSAKEAVELASKFDIYTGGGVDTLSFS